MRLTLSVPDPSIACSGHEEDHALSDTLDLATHCEAPGYRRRSYALLAREFELSPSKED